MNTNPEEGSNTLHAERPKFNERRRFSSYGEYKKIRNRPIKDQLFKKHVKQGFATGEVGVLGTDEPGGYASSTGDGREVDDEVGWP